MPECVVVREAKPLVVEGDVNVKVDGAVLVEDFVAAESATVAQEVKRIQVLPRTARPLHLELFLQKRPIFCHILADLLVTILDVLDQLHLIGDELGLVIPFVVVMQRVLKIIDPLWKVHADFFLPYIDLARKSVRLFYKPVLILCCKLLYLLHLWRQSQRDVIHDFLPQCKGEPDAVNFRA